MKDVTFEGLKKELLEKEENETTNKDLDLILALEEGTHNVLSQLDSATKNDPEFMLPLLYAYKNKHGTFDVYRHCGTAIQDNWDIADQVVRLQPSLIADTNLINDPEFIVSHLEAVPELRHYLSKEMLKNDDVKEIIERMDKPDVMVVAGAASVAAVGVMTAVSAIGSMNIEGNEYTIEQLENVSLIPHLETFVKEDFDFFQRVSVEKRDDASYLKEIVAKNINAAAYIAEHVDDFEIRGLDAVAEQMEVSVIEKARRIFEEQLKEVEEQLLESPEDHEKQLYQRKLKEQIMSLNEIQKNEDGVKRSPPEKMLEELCDGLDEQTKAELQQYLMITTAVTEKKNDVGYVKNYVTKNSEETGEKITYVASTAKTFGIDSLEAVKQIATDRTKETAMAELEHELEVLEEKEQRGETLSEEEQKDKEQLDKIKKFIKKAEERINEGKTTNERVARLVKAFCTHLDPKYQQMVSEIVQMDDAVVEKRSHEATIKHEDLRKTVLDTVTIEAMNSAAKKLGEMSQYEKEENAQEAQTNIDRDN